MRSLSRIYHQDGCESIVQRTRTSSGHDVGRLAERTDLRDVGARGGLVDRTRDRGAGKIPIQVVRVSRRSRGGRRSVARHGTASAHDGSSVEESCSALRDKRKHAVRGSHGMSGKHSLGRPRDDPKRRTRTRRGEARTERTGANPQRKSQRRFRDASSAILTCRCRLGGASTMAPRRQRH